MIIRSKDSFYTKFGLYLIITALAVSFFGGLFIGRGGITKAEDVNRTDQKVTGIGTPAPNGELSGDLQFSRFWELWKLLKLKYYKDVSEKDMYYGALKGITEAIGDPYTTYFEPVTAKEFSDSLKGEFEGIGAEIGIKNGQLQVIAPLPDTPAEKAGLLAGDYILAINGTSTEGMFTEQAVMLIRGPKDTKVTLKIGRINKSKSTDKNNTTKITQEPEVKDVEIIRGTITVKSVTVKWPEADIPLVQISSFDEKTDTEFTKAMDGVLAKNPKALIIDLRNDPGGYLDRATAVAGEWVGNRVVVIERRKGQIIDEFHGTGNGRLSNLPTVILINQGSASASEIVAGALQDYGLATLIGIKTFGKGSVQDYTEFEDGSAVKVTIAEWLTPKSRSINKTGIEPDIQVDRTTEDYNENRDPQLDKALEYIHNPSAVKQQAASTTVSR